MRSKSAQKGAGSMPEEFKLLFGLCWSLKALSAAIDPQSKERKQMGTPMKIGEGCSFKSFSTNAYKLHFYETPSGIKLILTTSPNVGDMSKNLEHIYRALFVDLVMKNPLYTPGEQFLFEPFTLALNKYMSSLNLC
jgi:hypothetical protein